MEQIAAEKALEVQRLKSQISTKGMIQTSTRMAEVRQAEVALARELAAAELETAAARTAATNREIALTAELAAAKTGSGCGVKTRARPAGRFVGAPGGHAAAA